MISLSDEELAVIMESARPIPARERDHFLQDIAAELAQHQEIGPGLIGRLSRDMQRRYIGPPALHGNALVGKYGRWCGPCADRTLEIAARKSHM
jgi:hypothetical protein